MNTTAHKLIIRHLGTLPYHTTYNAMRQFTEQRSADTSDEIWCVQHPAVFTQGRAGKPEHILHLDTNNPTPSISDAASATASAQPMLETTDIIGSINGVPLIQSDRGGQVTYHGEGQATIYLLCDLNRIEHGVRYFVEHIEAAIIDYLASLGITAHGDAKARGVYVQHKKIASIGLRIKNNCSYHGLALNINMDLQPFHWINPCGHADLAMTHIANELGTAATPSLTEAFTALSDKLTHILGYSGNIHCYDNPSNSARMQTRTP